MGVEVREMKETGSQQDWAGRPKGTRLKVAAAPEDVRVAERIYVLRDDGTDMTGPFGPNTPWFKFAAWFKVRPEIGTVYVPDEGEEAR
jgi:hypothetical protein